MKVWRHKNTAYTPRNIQPTVPYGGGSVMVWGCISHDCKLDLVTIQGNPTGDQYIRDVLQPVVVPHFDNHPLATRPVYMDDNARPYHSRAVTAYLQSEAVTSVSWPAMSPDLNPIEHIWDMLGRRIQARQPPVQNIRQLEAALHREWQQLSQQDIRRLT
jgi:transposase